MEDVLSNLQRGDGLCHEVDLAGTRFLCDEAVRARQNNT